MLPEGLRRILCLALAALCALFAGACRNAEQDQRKAFIDFLETHVVMAAGTDIVQMSDAIRKKVGNYSRHFDVIATCSKELRDIDMRLAGEKLRIAAPGPVPMDKLGSERARIEQLVAALSRSAQHADAAKAKADAAKTALKQPEDVQAVFDKAYEKEVSGYANASLFLYTVQKDFYAEALRMGVFLEKHRDKIHFKNKTVIIDEQALLQEYNALQSALQEKAQKMQSALAAGRP